MAMMLMKLVMRLECFLIRHFDVSLISRALARQTRMAPVPTMLLVTTGRRSGRRIESPMYYFPVGQSYFVIASKGGAPDHPAWYKNMMANPDVTICVKRRDVKVRAREVTGEERVRLWAIARAAYPAYDEYQKKAGTREIPVVVLDPR